MTTFLSAQLRSLRTLRVLFVFAALICGVCVGGCSSSPWQKNYVPTASAAALPEGAPVQVREVPWDRLQAGLKDIENDESKSDVHPADWSPEKKAQVRAKLLKTLQVSQDPATVTVVGRSDFRTTNELHPETTDQSELAAMARKMGANMVVWSRRLVGKNDVIIQEPVTTYYNGFGRRNRPFSGTDTTWVPVSVQADEYAFVAYFLKT